MSKESFVSHGFLQNGNVNKTRLMLTVTGVTDNLSHYGKKGHLFNGGFPGGWSSHPETWQTFSQGSNIPPLHVSTWQEHV